MNISHQFLPPKCFILSIGLCLEIKTCQLVMLPAWLQILKRNLLSSGAKVTIWRPFCLCKLGGQDLKIPLGNRVFRIQHTQIWLKSPVPNFYSKMPLESYRALFFRNSTSLIVILNGNVLSHAWHTWYKKGTNGKRMSCSLLVCHMQILKSIDFRTMGLWKWIIFFYTDKT